MDTGIGLGKEDEDDEDDTMQNTVVLFSNSDKFVMLQVTKPPSSKHHFRSPLGDSPRSVQ